MYRFQLFSYFLLLTCVGSHRPGSRILGGTEVKNRSEFSYQAAFLYKDEPVCSATIIDEKHVVTAAHCCSLEYDSVAPSELTLAVGSLDLCDKSNIKKVERVSVHENFSTISLVNDIAILRISGTFPNNDHNVRPINLQTNRITSGSCNVSGWGKTDNNDTSSLNKKLMYVEVPIVNFTICNEAYVLKNHKVICAGENGKDSCAGDSGGPLVCDGKLTGIVSYGTACGIESFPGVYTEIASYTDWIEEQKRKLAGAARNRVVSVTLMICFLFIKYII